METLSIIEWMVIGIGLWIAFRMGQISVLMLLKQEVRERILAGRTSDSAVRDVLAIEEPSEECVFAVEKHQGHYYAFAESGEFLAQGTDFRSMFGSIKQRFPNRRFRVNRMQAELTDEEAGRMVQAIFETFGDRNDTKSS